MRFRRCATVTHWSTGKPSLDVNVWIDVEKVALSAWSSASFGHSDTRQELPSYRWPSDGGVFDAGAMGRNVTGKGYFASRSPRPSGCLSTRLQPVAMSGFRVLKRRGSRPRMASSMCRYTAALLLAIASTMSLAG